MKEIVSPLSVAAIRRNAQWIEDDELRAANNGAQFAAEPQTPVGGD